jgi:hypothetical protein
MQYEALLPSGQDPPYDQLSDWLIEELPYAWLEEYCQDTPRNVRVDRVELNGFSYIFDNYSLLISMGEAPPSDVVDRLVGAIGRSPHPLRTRESSRLRGWVGPTELSLGKDRDKGHFIAHTIGGMIDGVELNVFPQRRDVNRGWSPAGKRYRQMESFCAAHPGTLCFSRPLYDDATSTPAFIEFGILLPERSWWVETFDNHVTPAP